MRKSIFIALAAGAVVLAGCAKIETTEVPEGRVISFDNYVSNAVKSIDTEEDLTDFYVFGKANNGSDVIFDNVLVKKNGENWETEVTRYWNETKTDYKFAAYSNDNAKIDGASLEYAEGALKIQNYNQANADDAKKDLIIGLTDKVTYSGADYTDGTLSGPVQLSFYHALSCVKFVFTKDATLNGVDLTLSNVSFTACSTATLNVPQSQQTRGESQLSSTVWTGHTTPAVSYFCDSLSASVITGTTTDNSVTPKEETFFLIPQYNNGADHDLQMTFTLTWPTDALYGEGTGDNTESKIYTVDLKSNKSEWRPGYRYIYTATINAENLDLVPIEFDVQEIQGWNDPEDNSGDITVQN